jgi:hypothetical protein
MSIKYKTAVAALENEYTRTIKDIIERWDQPPMKKKEMHECHYL